MNNPLFESDPMFEPTGPGDTPHAHSEAGQSVDAALPAYMPSGDPIHMLTDREIAEETLYWLREAGSALVQLQSGGVGGMMKMMMGGRK